MQSAVLLGFAYFTAVFAIAFLLGALREIVLAPLVGRAAVVLVEAPLILLAAWLWSGFLLRHFPLPLRILPHLAMGLVAFALLMIAEAMLAILLMGRTLAEHLAIYATPAGALELLPQVAFALLPALHVLRRPA